jgi:hypothetical protein
MEIAIIDFTSDFVFNYFFSIMIYITVVIGGFIGALGLIK